MLYHLVSDPEPGDRLSLSSYQYMIPMLKIRRSRDRLIFNMGIPIHGKDGLYIETGPWAFPVTKNHAY